MSINRRTFFMSASAALAASAPLRGGETLRAASIGVGGRGTRLLTTALEIPGLRFTYLCDINAANLDKALSLAARDKPKGVKDYRRLLEAKDVDAVFIATPCYLHREMIIAALEAGKNVYCEKPMAITPEDNRAVLEAARKAKGKLQIGFQGRYSPRRREMLRRLHAGQIGKLLFIRGQYYTPRDLPHHQAWKFQRDKFGDMIVEQAVHQFDLYNWMFQGHPLKACGMGGTNLYVNDPPGRTIMDHYTVSYEYPGGAHLSFSHIYYAVGELRGVGEVVFGSKGALDTGTGRFYDRAKNAVSYTVDIKEGRMDATRLAIESFLEAIREDKEPFANAEVGRLGALASIMGLRAMLEGRTVEWKEVDL